VPRAGTGTVRAAGGKEQLLQGHGGSVPDAARLARTGASCLGSGEQAAGGALSGQREQDVVGLPGICANFNIPALLIACRGHSLVHLRLA
jgi:hypothetical protein